MKTHKSVSILFGLESDTLPKAEASFEVARIRPDEGIAVLSAIFRVPENDAEENREAVSFFDDSITATFVDGKFCELEVSKYISSPRHKGLAPFWKHVKNERDVVLAAALHTTMGIWNQIHGGLRTAEYEQQTKDRSAGRASAAVDAWTPVGPTSWFSPASRSGSGSFSCSCTTLRCLSHRARTAFLAISDRSSAVSTFARALPPFEGRRRRSHGSSDDHDRPDEDGRRGRGQERREADHGLLGEPKSKVNHYPLHLKAAELGMRRTGPIRWNSQFHLDYQATLFTASQVFA